MNDLYLPALPAITETEGFGASMAHAQFTLSALLLSFGVSQLIWGPLSDRRGGDVRTRYVSRATKRCTKQDGIRGCSQVMHSGGCA